MTYPYELILKNPDKINAPIIIASSQIDNHDQRKSKKEAIDAYADKLGLFHIETSSLLNIGIDEMFMIIAEMAYYTKYG